ncbi:hypothetical protein U9M48_010213 [Paspalum notatum var. saurae]|uniref:Uncharacterized protein n=1 Tax=Paspalum notatum var. saurae TaxID=547442 RepID=A0AAQ3ST04_PASNO
MGEGEVLAGKMIGRAAGGLGQIRTEEFPPMNSRFFSLHLEPQFQPPARRPCQAPRPRRLTRSA